MHHLGFMSMKCFLHLVTVHSVPYIFVLDSRNTHFNHNVQKHLLVLNKIVKLPTK